MFELYRAPLDYYSSLGYEICKESHILQKNVEKVNILAPPKKKIPTADDKTSKHAKVSHKPCHLYIS